MLQPLFLFQMLYNCAANHVAFQTIGIDATDNFAWDEKSFASGLLELQHLTVFGGTDFSDPAICINCTVG